MMYWEFDGIAQENFVFVQLELQAFEVGLRNLFDKVCYFIVKVDL